MPEIQRFIRSKRKTLALIVEQDGSLTVRAPLRMPEAEVHRFIRHKSDWIHRKQAQALQTMPVPKRYIDGESFLYLGNEYTLRIVPTQVTRRGDQISGLVLEGEFQLLESRRAEAKDLFIEWYRQQARQVFAERVGHFAGILGVEVRKLRISSARTRWGSCSPKGTLSYTWRLVMAPLTVVDYVVVHELCHLKEMSHSKAFWGSVAAVMPGYIKHRRWLKTYGGLLNL